MQIRFREVKHIRTAAAGNRCLNKSHGWRSCAVTSHNLKTFAASIRLRSRRRRRAEWNRCGRRGDAAPRARNVQKPSSQSSSCGNVIFFWRARKGRVDAAKSDFHPEFETQLTPKKLEKMSIPAFFFTTTVDKTSGLRWTDLDNHGCGFLACARRSKVKPHCHVFCQNWMVCEGVWSPIWPDP